LLPGDSAKHHIPHRNSFSNTDSEFDPGIISFENRISGARSGDENHRNIGARDSNRFFQRIKNRNTFHMDSAFAGSNTGNDSSAVFPTLAGMEKSGPAGNPLNNYFGISIYEYRHVSVGSIFVLSFLFKR
jgi:hypothetical protein